MACNRRLVGRPSPLPVAARWPAWYYDQWPSLGALDALSASVPSAQDAEAKMSWPTIVRRCLSTARRRASMRLVRAATSKCEDSSEPDRRVGRVKLSFRDSKVARVLRDRETQPILRVWARRAVKDRDGGRPRISGGIRRICTQIPPTVGTSPLRLSRHLHRRRRPHGPRQRRASQRWRANVCRSSSVVASS